VIATDQGRQTTRGSPQGRTPIGRRERAWGAGLVRRFYGPSVLRRRHSGRLSHRSWLAVWRSTGAIMGNVVNDFLLFSCMALFVTGIVVAAASPLI
jgi:hypothetical protein